MVMVQLLVTIQHRTGAEHSSTLPARRRVPRRQVARCRGGEGGGASHWLEGRARLAPIGQAWSQQGRPKGGLAGTPASHISSLNLAKKSCCKLTNLNSAASSMASPSSSTCPWRTSHGTQLRNKLNHRVILEQLGVLQGLVLGLLGGLGVQHVPRVVARAAGVNIAVDRLSGRRDHPEVCDKPCPCTEAPASDTFPQSLVTR